MGFKYELSFLVDELKKIEKALTFKEVEKEKKKLEKIKKLNIYKMIIIFVVVVVL